MDVRVIRDAVRQIQEELNKPEDVSAANAVYQVYCECNRFIALEIKRIIAEEGTVTKDHPEIEPLYKILDFILPIMKNYSILIREQENGK
jgi:hypothetical protein